MEIFNITVQRSSINTVVLQEFLGNEMAQDDNVWLKYNGFSITRNDAVSYRWVSARKM